MYRIGYPFWRTFARMGVPLFLRIDVLRDHEAGVFVAKSDNLRGLVAEAPTMDELVVEIQSVIDDLMTVELRHAPASPPIQDLRLCCA